MAIDGVNFLLQQNFQYKNLYDFYFSDSPDIRYKVKSTTLPFPILESESLMTGERYYTGYVAGGDFSIEIYENETFDTYNYFNTWFESVFDTKTKKFKTFPIIKSATMEFTRKQFPLVATKRFFYEGIKILGFEPISVDYSDGDPLIYQINMAVDNVRPA